MNQTELFTRPNKTDNELEALLARDGGWVLSSRLEALGISKRKARQYQEESCLIITGDQGYILWENATDEEVVAWERRKWATLRNFRLGFFKTLKAIRQGRR